MDGFCVDEREEPGVSIVFGAFSTSDRCSEVAVFILSSLIAGVVDIIGSVRENTIDRKDGWIHGGAMRRLSVRQIITME